MEKWEQICEKIEVATYLLNNYGGEEIVAHEHPLHTAIQEVEKLCRRRSITGGKHFARQNYFLPRVVDVIWYHLLDCSRGKGLHRPYVQDFVSAARLDSILPQDKELRKKALAIMLSVALNSMANILKLYAKCEGNLPLKPEEVDEA